MVGRQGSLASYANMRKQRWGSPETKAELWFSMVIGWRLFLGGQLGLLKSSVSTVTNAFWLFHGLTVHHIPVLPYRRHIESISQLNQEERDAFADMLSRISRRYDNLFSCSFAYSMGIHQRPVPPNETTQLDAENSINFAHLHLHFEPPLLRSASVRKFLVG